MSLAELLTPGQHLSGIWTWHTRWDTSTVIAHPLFLVLLAAALSCIFEPANMARREM